ncbi:hypothetical protein [Gordonia sp. VNK21]|uniref:hypothetical protein n=1 Tax=Gordonia sp. VNK21 TaxID=3382483 RepID=UPI0038D3ABDF
MSSRDAMRALDDPSAVADLVQSAQVILWDGRHPHVQPFASRDQLPLAQMHPVRRIGTYHGARSRFAYHPTEFDGHRHLVLAESLLECSWMQQLDRRPEHWGYLGQALWVTWRLGERQITHVPDIVGQDVDGHQWIVDVRHTQGMNTRTGVVMDVLMRATCIASGIDYQLFNDLNPQRRRNLEFLSTMRWRRRVEDTTWWPTVIERKPKQFVDLAAAAGGGPFGRNRALHVIAQCHVDIDLDLPITSTTDLRWRLSDGE